MALLILSSLARAGGQDTNSSSTGDMFECPVTLANGGKGGSFANEFLKVILPPGGKIESAPPGVSIFAADGSLSWKFGWERRVRGQLIITGRRLDGPAPPLRSHVPDGYGDIGFQSTSLLFPRPGCWEVTGHMSDKSLTFVLLALKGRDQPPPYDKW